MLCIPCAVFLFKTCIPFLWLSHFYCYYIYKSLCHFQSLQDFTSLTVHISWFNFLNLVVLVVLVVLVDFQEISTISFIHIRIPIVQKINLRYHEFENNPFIWINSEHVFLSSVWKVSLKGYSQTPKPPCVFWSSHYSHWPGSRCRPPPGVAHFFLNILLYISKKFCIFINILILFHYINRQEFYRKTVTFLFKYQS